MSDNNLTTTEEQNKQDAMKVAENQPVVSGPNEGEVKDFNAVDDDHPLVAETGDTALKTQTESGAGEFLSDFIYEHDSAWVREWLQNEETACVRAGKLLIRISEEYPEGWLTQEKWIDASTGETVKDTHEDQTVIAEFDGDAADLRQMEIPRPIDDVLEAARSLGYDPTIVWDVYRDQQEIVTEDNGIGMTPYEFDKAFNTIFNSGSGVDGETGGMFGVGSESSALVHGKSGGAECETRSRRPTSDGNGYDGFRAYSYLGGATALPGEVEDGFMGTRFIIPVQESFNLGKLQGWVEDYTEKLRVPLLYREHDAGTTPVEEEYEATTFTEDYGDMPVVIDRPGEFSIVAGPDIIDTSYHSDDDEDTFLVSMPLDRNTRANISTFWDVVIQIHDEQGRIVMGPNRGYYSDGSKVYRTSEKSEAIGDLQDEDIMSPQPTGSRDSLQRDSLSKEFFYYIEDVVKSEELRQVAEITEDMKAADHPADAIRGEEERWTLFNKMVSYHGSRRITDNRSTFKQFLDDRDEFPSFDKDETRKLYSLFKEVEHCHKGAGRSSKKSDRRERELGEILSENDDDDNVYMAASTGGNFKKYFQVIENTHFNPEVIVISGANKYDTWSEQFGFKVLTDVPLKRDDDHDYDVPQVIHDQQVKKGKKNTGKADDVMDRALKIRTSADNSSIDQRLSIDKARETLDKNGNIGGNRKLVLFPRTADENISDHYEMAEYAAIAAVSKTEYEALADHERVLTYEEFTEWSEAALIATEDGAMTPEKLVEDDRMVIVAYRGYRSDHEVVKLLADENEQLRGYYAGDIRDQHDWALMLDGFDGGYGGDDVDMVPDIAKDDTLFAVACKTVLDRAKWSFDNMDHDNRNIVGLKLHNDQYGYNEPFGWWTLNKKTTRYRLMADTPNWDDSSDIYDMFPSRRDSRTGQLYLGLHDRGVDPSEKSPEELRNLIS